MNATTIRVRASAKGPENPDRLRPSILPTTSKVAVPAQQSCAEMETVCSDPFEPQMSKVLRYYHPCALKPLFSSVDIIDSLVLDILDQSIYPLLIVLTSDLSGLSPRRWIGVAFSTPHSASAKGAKKAILFWHDDPTRLFVFFFFWFNQGRRLTANLSVPARTHTSH